MNTAMASKQRGLSFSGFMAGAVILILVSVTGLKLIPAYIQNATIKNVFVAVANDPEMQKASIRDIQMAYNKRSSVEDIRAITVEDIEIEKDAGRLVLSASYFVKIPLVSNISLYLDFNPSSD
ncbi:MAG TPA: DUF4845 domain-containing protein [Gallionella sp.]|jgi:hypothetical protein|nr:DUF4845 domain-containing protein [Gallionella sp.]